jgi:protein-disulfide isomerase/uncharacterized membrane protein
MWERLKKALPILILAGIGLGVSIAIEVVHRRLAADVNYASFCYVNARVNCDVVLSSGYALLAGISVSTWGIAYYLVLVGLALVTVRAGRASARQNLANLILVLAGWGLLFSIYLAVVAFAVLQSVCLMCGALYLVNIGLFVAAWRLRTSTRMAGRRAAAEYVRQDRLVLIGSLLAAVALVVIGSWEALGRSVRLNDPSQISQQRPEFYHWYFAQPVVNVPLDAGSSRGSPHAPVTIVEFSDFECGHCAAFHQTLDDLLRRTGQQVRVVFRNFPLDSACNPAVPERFHPQACLAAMAAECAAEQGKFWQYHDLLFDNQQQLERQFLIGYAARLDLDVARFTTCLGSEAVRARVERDAKDGAQLGVDSTPTLFINGRTIRGALDSQRLSDAVVLARSGR